MWSLEKVITRGTVEPRGDVHDEVRGNRVPEVR